MKGTDMKKYLLNAALIWMAWFALMTNLYAEQTVSVAVFPFSVQASKPHQALGTDLPQMLGNSLEKEGTQVVYVTDDMNTETWNTARFQQEGIRLGVDHIITGNIFIAGSGISIDTIMHPVYESGPPLPFFLNPILWKSCMPQQISWPGQSSANCLKNESFQKSL